MRSIWLSQRQAFQRLATDEGLDFLGRRGDLKAALRFGELLTLAPDEYGASSLMREDREGALSFLEVSANLDEAIADAAEESSSSELAGPLHELADFVVEFLVELRKMDPTKFE